MSQWLSIPLMVIGVLALLYLVFLIVAWGVPYSIWLKLTGKRP
jgi:hypothetical protein